MNKYLLIGTAALLSAASSFCFAENTPTRDCANYLSYSDPQFINLVSHNQSLASTIADALNNCALASACSSISVDHCSALLSTRSFISAYFANFKGDSVSSAVPHGGGFSAAPKLPTTALPIVNPPANTPSPVADQPSSTQTKKQDSSNIHWF
ncbi:hypothetical protein [Coxiella burnetii]|uniref:hypothetical protein n=1 Tax=Coxiella burnetii TaxID=777 RepID=UPI00217682CD|nr:hypothetical protein [Coxiella burnetii]